MASHSIPKLKKKSEADSSASGVGASTHFVDCLNQSSPAKMMRLLLGSNVTLEEFFTQYWEKKPFHVSRQSKDFYRDLFSKAAFDAHVRQHAEDLQYGFDLNICVCSAEGKKVDKNPPRKSKVESEGDEEGAEEEEEEVAPPPAAALKSSKKSPAVASKSSSKKQIAEEEGVETMTIAQALKLAAAQQQKLRPNAAAAEPEEDEEEEEDENENQDETEEGQDEEGDDEDESMEDEEELDGTSVATIKKYAPVTFAVYDRLYKEGCTVQALQPQQYTRSMWQLVSQFESFFGGLVGANCYLTPKNSQGLAPHHDDVDVFVLQLEGEKSWKLYEPKMNLPREHSGDFAREELDEPFQELLLKPGDLMYLPRGVIHEARTSDKASSHMTVSVYQKTSWYDLLLTLFPMALESAFYSDKTDEFRKGLPLQFLNFMGSAAALEEELNLPQDANTTPASPAEPKKSRQQLRSDMSAQLSNLITKLGPILESNLDACVDEMSKDFMNSRLPPPPPPPSASSNPFAMPSSSSTTSVTGEELGPEPTADSKVRFIAPTAMRMSIIQNEEEENEAPSDMDEDESPDSQHILLTHSLYNSAAHHLDGRFPPESAQELHIPIYYAPAIFQLLRQTNKYHSVATLPLALDDMLNGEGEEPSEEEQMEARLELVKILWEAQVLRVQTATASTNKATPSAAVATAKNGATKLPKKRMSGEGMSTTPAAASSIKKPLQKKHKV